MELYRIAEHVLWNLFHGERWISLWTVLGPRPPPCNCQLFFSCFRVHAFWWVLYLKRVRFIKFLTFSQGKWLCRVFHFSETLIFVLSAGHKVWQTLAVVFWSAKHNFYFHSTGPITWVNSCLQNSKSLCALGSKIFAAGVQFLTYFESSSTSSSEKIRNQQQVCFVPSKCI